MPTEWPTARVEDVAEKVAIGPFGSSIKVETFVPEGIPVISGQHLRGTRVEDNGHNFITLEHAERLKNANVFRGDVIFTHAGNIGQAAYIPPTSKYERYIISQRQFYMRCDKSKIIPEFVAYYFATPEGRHQLLANASPVGVPSIAQPVSYLRTLEIPVPPLPEQRAIAGVLGALDDKIELNRRMNETLEAIAQAEFRRMMEEGGGKSAELGEIAEVIDCLHSKKPVRQPTGKPFLQLCNIRDDGLIDMTDTYCITEDDYAYWISRMEASPGDCVITNVGRVAATAQIPAGLHAALGRNMTGIRCRQSFPYPTFLIECLRSPDMKEEVTLKTDSGTILDALNVRSIPKLRFRKPSDEIVKTFEMKCRPLRARMEYNHAESRTLSALRDALLPKLLSGAVRVRPERMNPPSPRLRRTRDDG